MAESTCSTEALKIACAVSVDEGAPWVDLSPLLGLSPGEGPSVAVSNIIGVIADHEHPEITVGWDDKYLTLSHTDGGFMATFELRF